MPGPGGDRERVLRRRRVPPADRHRPAHRGRQAFGVALAHVWPSAHPVEEAVEAARLAADALGVTDGPTYTQIVLGPDGPRVMELAARLGGGHDAELCRVALGVDLNGLALAAALGEPRRRARSRSRAAAPSSASSSRRRASSRTSTASRRRWRVEGVLDARVYRAAGLAVRAASGAAPTGPASSSRAATAATTRSRAPTAPPSSSASGPPMQKLSSRRNDLPLLPAAGGRRGGDRGRRRDAAERLAHERPALGGARAPLRRVRRREARRRARLRHRRHAPLAWSPPASARATR